jgi:hypothetical protein
MEATALSPRKDARSTARNPPPKSKDGAGKKPTAAASPTPASKGAPDRISRAQSVEEVSGTAQGITALQAIVANAVTGQPSHEALQKQQLRQVKSGGPSNWLPLK